MTNINASKLRTVAEKAYNNETESIETGLHGKNNQDFILCYETLGTKNDVYYVGIRQDDGKYAVAALAKGSETIEQNSNRYQTSTHTYVKVKMYHGELEETPENTEEFVNTVREETMNGDLEYKDKGTLYGYRVRTLEEMLEDVFIGYTPS